MSQKPSFLFWGTPDVARDTLQILIENDYIPTLVITGPDKPQGRGLELTPSPVKILAEEHFIPVQTPETISESFIDSLIAEYPDCDVNIVVAYGHIFPTRLISFPRLGTINIHYSLLPKYRGASPVESALLHGETITGVTIQQMVRKMDRGPIIASQEIPIDISDTKSTLRRKLIKEGTELLVRIFPELLNGTLQKIEQDETQATYSKKIAKEDGEINLNDDPFVNYNKYRAYEGWPGIYFFVEHTGKKTRVKITHARYENDSFIIESVIPENRKEMGYDTFIKSYRL